MRVPGVHRVTAAPGRGAGQSRRVLLVLTGLLVASGIVRAVDGIGLALAGGAPAEAATAAAGTQPAQCVADPDIAPLLEAMKARETAAVDKEARLAAREAALQDANKALEARLAALRSAQAELSRSLTIADQAAEADVTRLVAVYEAMKPKDAVALFGAMDTTFAAGFIGRMRPESAAAILAGMEPKQAYTISAVLAGRNANAPKN